jgi:hypothetical protein
MQCKIKAVCIASWHMCPRDVFIEIETQKAPL